MKYIKHFRNEYAFLSNFAPSPIIFEGIQYPTIEHAFQGAKCINKSDKLLIASQNNPTSAKRIGRRVKMRDDWDSIKLNIMYNLLLAKFQIPQYRQMLLATNDDIIVEENYWNDTYWGVCNGVGQNYLGRLLMQVRETLKQNQI